MKASVLLKRLILSFVVILIFTGAAKIWTSFGSAKLLAQADPIVGITFSHLMLVAGIMELAVAFACWRSLRTKNVKLGAFAVAWLSTVILVYRFGLLYMHWRRPCHCLGNFTDAIHIPENLADNIIKLILAYLLISSYGILIWQWKSRWRFKAEAPEAILMS